jgi:hypothetical protein
MKIFHMAINNTTKIYKRKKEENKISFYNIVSERKWESIGFHVGVYLYK